MGRSTVAIWVGTPLQNLLMTVKVVALEKICFSDRKNPKAVYWHIDSRSEALSPYQRQFNGNYSDSIISKTKNVSGFFFIFLKSVLNFKHFPKKDDSHS